MPIHSIAAFLLYLQPLCIVWNHPEDESILLRRPDRPLLLDLQTTEQIEARIDDLGLKHVGLIENWWSDLSVDSVKCENEIDRHWRWNQFLVASAQYECFPVGCFVKKSLQGAMAFGPRESSLTDPMQPAVEIYLLATAPRNRPRVTKTPKFKRIGTALALNAIMYSYRTSRMGRTFAFAHPTAVEFYRKLSFQSTNEILQGKIGMELAPDDAQALLRTNGLIL